MTSERSKGRSTHAAAIASHTQRYPRLGRIAYVPSGSRWRTVRAMLRKMAAAP